MGVGGGPREKGGGLRTPMVEHVSAPTVRF